MTKSSQYKIIDKIYAEAVKGISVDKSILRDFEKWKRYCLELPEKQHVTYTIILFDSQVKNGGFHQYFFNSYGIFCFYTVENLKKIMCMKHADLLEQAISVIYDQTNQREEFLRNVFQREVDVISSFEEHTFEKLNLIDNEYYKIEENEINIKLESYLLG